MVKDENNSSNEHQKRYPQKQPLKGSPAKRSPRYARSSSNRDRTRHRKEFKRIDPSDSSSEASPIRKRKGKRKISPETRRCYQRKIAPSRDTIEELIRSKARNRSIQRKRAESRSRRTKPRKLPKSQKYRAFSRRRQSRSSSTDSSTSTDMEISFSLIGVNAKTIAREIISKDFEFAVELRRQLSKQT